MCHKKIHIYTIILIFIHSKSQSSIQEVAYLKTSTVAIENKAYIQLTKKGFIMNHQFHFMGEKNLAIFHFFGSLSV